ncbi:zinc finger protein 280C isoform X2 [Nerophis ophidion]|uniref:zinc finger protein 280C isoform X2 n=1 Tax=Nerophis ophidion TaxID=159077 RepID=UPI002AE08FAA|nr:zinc finger protein 280C isoform X2 [Nerophis ophidion]
MVVSCWVNGCTNRRQSSVKRGFFSIPRIRRHEGELTQKISEDRRRAWLASINRKDEPSQSSKICSDHFVTGKPAALYDRSHPDWAPSVKLSSMPVLTPSKTKTKTDSSLKRSNMSELFMECVEEELEPWQKAASEQLIEDDDEPIFVGVLPKKEHNSDSIAAPRSKDNVRKHDAKSVPATQPTLSSSSIMLPLKIAGNAITGTSVANLTTLTPRPVIVNNQGFIVTSPQLTNNSNLIATLGKQYPPGTKFTIVPAGQQKQLLQRVTPVTTIPGVVHRPHVQQITSNVSQANSLQTITMPVQANSVNTEKNTMKRVLPQEQMVNIIKKIKVDVVGQSNTTKPVENGTSKKKCPNCQEEFYQQEALNHHMTSCLVRMDTNISLANSMVTHKLIMLVSDFYYGQADGQPDKTSLQRSNTTFKCQSCMKVLKSNIRFMNHMKHHLELEKQSNESWESHTTCQHCYRQYLTPFQLQCHIESAHSPIESTTNCKICELAFESEQVLLEHMKDNHKPGEMPYVCQVCNYRSSFFSDVETHFRTVHENTKDLLCPFCLKVLRSSHMYMQHFMKHQNKGIHRCGKCRLNFLTNKDRVEHRTQVHKTFKKPEILEGLPAGTKVTIRASLSGKTPALSSSVDRATFTLTPETLSVGAKTKPPLGLSKSKPNPSETKPFQRKKNMHGKFNMSLTHISVNGGIYTCIECNARVEDFFLHFPVISNCGACNYRTCCKVAIGNHMIRFHSTVNKSRFHKMDQKKHSSVLKFTLVCLNCDLLVNASGGDIMSKHLNDRPNHVCKVIEEKDNRAGAGTIFVPAQPTAVSKESPNETIPTDDEPKIEKTEHFPHASEEQPESVATLPVEDLPPSLPASLASVTLDGDVDKSLVDANIPEDCLPDPEPNTD